MLWSAGLHDYNQGADGVAEYGDELERIVVALEQRLGDARLVFLNTSPAHNTPDAQDNPTVVALNARAEAIMGRHGIHVVDIYSRIMARCGPVPFADAGPKECQLCAPHCKALAVHYTGAGYKFIAEQVAAALGAGASRPAP